MIRENHHKNTNGNLKLTAPWHIFRNKLAAMFELDEEVSVSPVSDGENGKYITVSVSNHAKAAALGKILPKSVEFGIVPLTVTVTDVAAEETPAEIARAAFAYNRMVRDIRTDTDAAGAEHTYVIFEPDVMQFFNDDLSDYQGNFNALFEDAARDLFDVDPSVNFCTADLREN